MQWCPVTNNQQSVKFSAYSHHVDWGKYCTAKPGLALDCKRKQVNHKHDQAKLDFILTFFHIRNLQELLELFQSIDKDDSGKLSLVEVILFLKSMTDDISEANIKNIFGFLDESEDKTVDFEEFKVCKNNNIAQTILNPSLGGPCFKLRHHHHLMFDHLEVPAKA